MSITVVVPAYKSASHIIDVLDEIPDYVSRILVIDDKCPDHTGRVVEENSTDKRVEVIYNHENLGVGGATIVGFREALAGPEKIIVKLDSDGQMDPLEIGRLVHPIESGHADYVKGNRFNSLDDLQEMPRVRVMGNAALSLMSKFSTGYWSISDPTNGFFAIHRRALEKIHLEKLRKGWFFESDLLFRLSIVRACVVDLPMRARYGPEQSNLHAGKVIIEFLHRHNINFLKRVLYLYYLRDWSIVSFELPASLVLLFSGFGIGLNFWLKNSAADQASSTGEVMLSVLPIILGFQLLLSVLAMDVQNEPKKALYSERRVGEH